ncbi:hypothetical protein DYB31_011457 [Aphanomyces astaci]|uniref:Uncharacterized protein n=1 Tax=Aphanomyces astaci TaxID=112090 RepID=A0A397EMS6_APHAT|nr:hypothetical protein DYB31_011457 [Aphanomyces astaci]
MRNLHDALSGHTSSSVAEAVRYSEQGQTKVCHSFQLAKDCGYKIVAHMMPDLPNMGTIDTGSTDTVSVSRYFSRKHGVACRDIRTREVGMKGIHDQISPDQVELVRRDYVANGGYY